MLLLCFALSLAQPFSIDLPEGNHRVTVVLGDDSEAAETTLRAEVRRLYLDRVRTGPGDSLTRTFIVNVRRPEISGTSESVRLKDREKTTEAENWDGKLTLRWDGKVRSIDVAPAPTVPTLFLAGDSTVADQAGEVFGSWGQYLPALFGPDIAVASHAESGESARSFLGERRWSKLLSVARKGDFLLIQFGHNDQKAATIEQYKGDLTRFVTEAKAKGITPILVTPMERQTLGSLGEFPDAVRQVAAEQSVALIDLNKLSVPIAGKPANFAPNDTTHHSPAGAVQLARLVAESIRSQHLPLARYLKQRVLLIGDSTVRNGQGNGSNGQWGWGEPLAGLIGDWAQVTNRALGGRSTKTFITGGQWAEAQAMIQPGDTVLIQFGHNDASPVNDKSRARGTLKGIGDETEEIDNELTGKHEVVHTFGWYLRLFIAGIREKGGKPVLVTPIPGNSFKNGKVSRRPHSEWARQVAAAEHVPLIDLEKLVAAKYEQMGEAAAQPMFHGDHTHTSWAGAVINARFVADALSEMK